MLLLGCASLYTGVVTITSVVDAAMKDWAALSVAGKTNPAIDKAVTQAHDKYRQSAAVAQTALMTYKTTGNQSDYLNALAAVRAAADGLINLVVPLVTPNEASTLSNNLKKASAI